MNRRQAIENVSALLGTMIFPSILSSCRNKGQREDGTESGDKDQAAMFDEISDAMLPTTPDSPGAKEAGCGVVMTRIISDCYTSEDAESIARLIQEIDKSSKSQFDRPFVQLSYSEKLKVLTPFDQKKEEPYVKLKELVVYVYFTSEIGMHKAMRYEEVPGRYDGCMEYKPGDKAWAWAFFSY